ncbi:MAG: hypothetical protein K8I02_06880, partial [Candidatus Methylomirabilis sp.]|nr:hypothetical protein [Deltaproteobacteria bacterium]
RVPRRRAATALAMLFLVVASFMAAEQARRATSGYGEAIAFIRERAGPRFVSTATYNTMAYVGYEGSALPPETWEELEGLYRAGYRYALVDFYKHYVSTMLGGAIERGLADPENVERLRRRGLYDKIVATMREWRARTDVLGRVEREAPRAATIPNPFGTNPGDMFEINTDFRETLRYLRSPPDGANEIRIFDLAPLFAKETP